MKNRPFVLYCLLSIFHPSIAMNILLTNTTEPLTATKLCAKGIKENNPSIVHDSILMGANVNYTQPGSKGLNFIQIACIEKDWRIVAHLLNSPHIDINAYKKATTPAFHCAVIRHNKNIIALLLAHDPHIVNIQNAYGETVLHMMCRENNKKMIAFLLTLKHIDPDIYNKTKETPLHIACICRSTRCIKPLIDHNANTLARNSAGEIPFERACSSEKIKSVKLLLPINKKEINITDYYGYTPLHSACLTNNIPISKFLLKKGASPVKKTNSQRTLLATAFLDGHNFNNFYSSNLKKLLLQKDKHGNTQLHLAVSIDTMYKKLDNYLLFLVENGLSVWSRNKHKKRPVDLACEEYNALYQEYITKRKDYLDNIMSIQEANMHSFLRITSPKIECALFTRLLQQKDIYKYSLPKELLIFIARIYYALNIETIIAKKHMYDKKYYESFIEEKDALKQKLRNNPKSPHLLWG